MSNTETLPYEVISIFPIPIYKTNIGRELTKQEQDELDAIVSKQTYLDKGPPLLASEMKQNIWSTKNLSIDKYLLKRKNFLSIQSFIEHHLKEYVDTILGRDTVKTSWAPHITQSWINVYEPKNYDSWHIHKNSIISGTFYINCLELPDDKTDGILFAPTSHHMLEEFDVPTKQDTIFSDKPHFVSVTEGSLILFPSSVSHTVNLNETSDQPRISLAFNSL